MDIYITGARRIKIPVLPPSYQITSQENDTIVNVIGVGDVVLTGKRGLQEVSFSSFFPRRYDASYCRTSSLRTPREYIDIIENMKRSGPVKLSISGILDGRFRIIDFPHGEDDGTGNVAYSLTFREYRAPSAQQSAVTSSEDTAVFVAMLADATDAAEGGEQRTQKQPEAGITVKPKPGESLSATARRYTGSTNYELIYKMNKDVIGDNPNAVTEGMWLSI